MACGSPRGSGVLGGPHASYSRQDLLSRESLAGAGTDSILICAVNTVSPEHQKNLRPEHTTENNLLSLPLRGCWGKGFQNTGAITTVYLQADNFPALLGRWG